MNQLRITTTEPHSMFSNNESDMLVRPDNIGEIIGESVTNKAYLHGKAEDLAGFDIPIIIDGDISMFDKPKHEQDILLLLPSGEYKCFAYYNNTIGASNCYLIELL